MQDESNLAAGPIQDSFDPNDADFRTVLESLAAAYQPFLREDLELASSLDKLAAAAADDESCDAELRVAQAVFERFWNEKVALAVLSPEARQVAGPVEQWRWCFLHIRCCMIFGFLLCRGPRGFRGWAYYLERYWRCVREVLGKPVGKVLSEAERKDLQTLTTALAEAYRPFLSSEMSTADAAGQVAEDLAAGKIDCFADANVSAAIFERLFQQPIAEALLGAEAFAARRQDRFFWFCRCWCLCAIRFGCCLARARRITDVARCVRFYRLCLRRCFQPLTCQLTGPAKCADEIANPSAGGFTVDITGTAAGAGFSHYILEWSTNDITYHATNFIYPPVPPGSTTQGNIPVFSGLLAYFNTTFQAPGLHFVRLTVFSVTGATCVSKISFELAKHDVRILGVGGYFSLSTSWADPAARFVETVPALCSRPVAPNSEVSFSGCVSVSGGAFVGGCDDKAVKSYRLDFKPGFETNCASPGWTNFWQVDYVTPGQKRFLNWRTDSSVLTSSWVDDCYVPSLVGPFCAPFTKVDPQSLLSPSCWDTRTSACEMSGLYTLRLTVEATDGSTYCDTQRIWLDNKPITGKIRIDAVPKCADLSVSQFATPPDCSTPWPLPVSGIAYDPLIDPMAPPSRPNDNFDHYYVRVTKQGGPSLVIPVPGPLAAGCFYGTQRVGSSSNCPGDPAGGDVYGTLAQFDLRAIDPLCSLSVGYPIPAGFTIPRGECCVYTFEVFVYDRTISSSGPHFAYDFWPVKICNDLRP